MSTLFPKLLQLKEMKQEFALKAMQTKRREVKLAEKAHLAAEAALHASAASYSERVDALYAPIIGRMTDLRAIADIESRVAQLDVDHELLAEAVHDAVFHLEGLEEALVTQSSAYAAAVRAFDRFSTLTDRVETAIRIEKERLDEIELDESFTYHNERLA